MIQWKETKNRITTKLKYGNRYSVKIIISIYNECYDCCMYLIEGKKEVDFLASPDKKYKKVDVDKFKKYALNKACSFVEAYILKQEKNLTDSQNFLMDMFGDIFNISEGTTDYIPLENDHWKPFFAKEE